MPDQWKPELANDYFLISYIFTISDMFSSRQALNFLTTPTSIFEKLQSFRMHPSTLY